MFIMTLSYCFGSYALCTLVGVCPITGTQFTCFCCYSLLALLLGSYALLHACWHLWSDGRRVSGGVESLAAPVPQRNRDENLVAADVWYDALLLDARHLL